MFSKIQEVAMNTIRALLALAFCFSLLGCPARSRSPFLTQRDISFDPRLVGSWSNVDDSEIMMFQRYGEKGYSVALREKDSSISRYGVHLGQIGKSWFLDSYSERGHNDYHLLPTHLLWRVWVGADTLRIASLEDDWLERMIDSGTLEIRHARWNGDVILTASTEELQKLVQRHAEDNGVFSEPDVFVRVR